MKEKTSVTYVVGYGNGFEGYDIVESSNLVDAKERLEYLKRQHGVKAHIYKKVHTSVIDSFGCLYSKNDTLTLVMA